VGVRACGGDGRPLPGAARRGLDVVVPAAASTLVSFRPESDPAALVRRLAERGVYVREVPGTGLVRVSCGWWTSDGDLERLAAALP
jgi:selenocysteine lyase/cysteine desulfurase